MVKFKVDNISVMVLYVGYEFGEKKPKFVKCFWFLWVRVIMLGMFKTIFDK